MRKNAQKKRFTKKNSIDKISQIKKDAHRPKQTSFFTKSCSPAIVISGNIVFYNDNRIPASVVLLSYHSKI